MTVETLKAALTQALAVATQLLAVCGTLFTTDTLAKVKQAMEFVTNLLSQPMFLQFVVFFFNRFGPKSRGAMQAGPAEIEAAWADFVKGGMKP